ncbi:hypothetical protein [Flavobacterium sp. B183]|uniref:hypothetical protein n=1 Tax=Flavobacterium sp. B183 TaxID=907046 RepID=UPI00273A5FE6|nr:hypothetical protein [Flavobacterium sp. B183]
MQQPFHLGIDDFLHIASDLCEILLDHRIIEFANSKYFNVTFLFSAQRFMVIYYLGMEGLKLYLTVWIIGVMPTNSPELKYEIFDARTADSSCLERLTDVSSLLIETLSLSCTIFQKRSGTH